MSALTAYLAREVRIAAPPIVARCAQHLHEHFGPATVAILFYGSALRAPEPDAVLDFYVLMEDLRGAVPGAFARAGARLLPPNVYAITVANGPDCLRCKAAVMTVEAFTRGMRAFAPHLWARFAQPTTLAYVRSETEAEQIVAALVQAVETAIAQTLPLMPAHFIAPALWCRALEESYATEIRPEALASRASLLVTTAKDRYDAVTAAVLGAADRAGLFARPRTRDRRVAGSIWRFRRVWGKTLNALRLMKAAFTYAGGLDYAVAKIARHSGVQLTVTDADRRRPLIGGIRIFIEACRKGGVR